MHAEHAVNRRIENAMAEYRIKSNQREMEFLDRAAQHREKGKPAKIQLSEADRQKLKASFSRAADRHQPRDHDRGRGRDSR